MENIIEKIENKKPQAKKYILKKTETKIKYKIDYKNELNERQYEAVTTVSDPVLVIAGAGSGKTRTLVYRLARLVESGVNPENILLLTFTRKASAEMLNRASLILDSRCEKVSGGTFHSFANSVLRKHSRHLDLNNSFTIIDKADSEDLINLIRGKDTEIKKIRFPRKSTISDIYSKAINQSRSIEEIIEREYSHFSYCTDKIIQVCENYVKYKKENSLLDYDDLLIYLKTLLLSNENIRKKLSQTYKYIMIDEYQDTNTLQSEIVKLLAYTHSNIMAVGDDAQSIYSFRGANFKNIINFPSMFEDAKVIKLEENYRSSQQILDLTNEIIKQAKEKYAKKLFTNNPQGEKPALVASPDSQTEAEFICQRVLEITEEGIPLNNICILTRSSRNTYNLEIELNKKSIPFKKVGGYKFVETAHIKDIIAHLRVILNPEDKISWHRILMLLEGIGNTTATKLIPLLAGKENKPLLPARKHGKENLNTLLELIESLRVNNNSPFEITKSLINYYQPIFVNKYDDFTKREKDLESFSFLAQNYSKLENFLSDLALEPPDSSFDGVENPPSNNDEYLTISTIL